MTFLRPTKKDLSWSLESPLACTSSEGQSAGESESARDLEKVEQRAEESDLVVGKDRNMCEKRSLTKKTKVRVHPKKLFSKPRSQSEAMMQVAKNIETSSKEQEKNKDERLKILLQAERKRDELLHAYQRNRQRQTGNMKCFWLNY